MLFKFGMLVPVNRKHIYNKKRFKISEPQRPFSPPNTWINSKSAASRKSTRAKYFNAHLFSAAFSWSMQGQVDNLMADHGACRITLGGSAPQIYSGAEPRSRWVLNSRRLIRIRIWFWKWVRICQLFFTSSLLTLPSILS